MDGGDGRMIIQIDEKGNKLKCQASGKPPSDTKGTFVVQQNHPIKNVRGKRVRVTDSDPSDGGLPIFQLVDENVSLKAKWDEVCLEK